MTDAAAVLDAARRRSDALVAADVDTLTQLLHPQLRSTTHRGDVLDREAYVAANTGGSLTWIDQQLQEPDVVVAGDTAVLTALVVDTVEREGRRQEFRMRLTQVWVRAGGAWACLAGHAGPNAA